MREDAQKKENFKEIPNKTYSPLLLTIPKSDGCFIFNVKTRK